MKSSPEPIRVPLGAKLPDVRITGKIDGREVEMCGKVFYSDQHQVPELPPLPADDAPKPTVNLRGKGLRILITLLIMFLILIACAALMVSGRYRIK